MLKNVKYLSMNFLLLTMLKIPPSQTRSTSILVFIEIVLKKLYSEAAQKVHVDPDQKLGLHVAVEKVHQEVPNGVQKVHVGDVDHHPRDVVAAHQNAGLLDAEVVLVAAEGLGAGAHLEKFRPTLPAQNHRGKLAK